MREEFSQDPSSSLKYKVLRVEGRSQIWLNFY